jgi:hypothetical protein
VLGGDQRLNSQFVAGQRVVGFAVEAGIEIGIPSPTLQAEAKARSWWGSATRYRRWTVRTIRSFDEALAAIEADKMITVCPQRTRISEWLKSQYPAVTVFEVDVGRISKSSAT